MIKKNLKKTNILLLCIKENTFLKKLLKREINAKKINLLIVTSNFLFRKKFKRMKKILCSFLSKTNIIFIISNMETKIEYKITLIIAKIIKSFKILSIFMKTQHIGFIEKEKIENYEKRVTKISKYFHSLIILPKKKLLKVLGKKSYLENFINLSNNIYGKIICNIIDPIISPGLIKVKLSDIYMIISQAKYCMIGFGSSSGNKRVKRALKKVYSNPLLENIKLSSIKKTLVNITSNKNISLYEFKIIKNSIYSVFSKNTKIVIGTSIKNNSENFIQISLIVTKIKIYGEKY